MLIDLEDKKLSFEYDKFHKLCGEKLKDIDNQEEFIKERRNYREYLEKTLELNKIKINQEELKINFSKIFKDKNSHQLLWTLNSKYIDNTFEKNYLDEISKIIYKSNQVIKGGINTYKINGWMTHVIYVYQIVNYNIANNIVPVNFDETTKRYMTTIIRELSEIYNTLNNTSKFILKIFCFIHDIGVVEDEKEHPLMGVKYVEQILMDIGITQYFLNSNQIKITIEELIQIMKTLIKNHIIYSNLSGEGSDAFVESNFKQLVKEIEDTKVNIREISKILFLFTIGDIIAVNEIIFNEGKYNRLKGTYKFFNEVIEEKPHNRNKKQVSIERLCDLLGASDSNEVERKVEEKFKEENIDIKLFWENLFNLEHFFHFSPIMKSLKDFNKTVELVYKLLDLIITKKGKNMIANTTITWIPNNKSKQAVNNIKNGSVLKCIEKLKESNIEQMVYDTNKVSIIQRDDKVYLDIEMI